MQQIEIEIACSCLFERCFQLRLGLIRRVAFDPCGEFGGELEAFARIAFHKCLADGVFAARIRPCRVEIGEACVHEAIDHRLDLFDIDDVILLRQPHESEAELFDVLAQIIHCLPLFPVVVVVKIRNQRTLRILISCVRRAWKSSSVHICEPSREMEAPEAVTP